MVDPCRKCRRTGASMPPSFRPAMMPMRCRAGAAGLAFAPEETMGRWAFAAAMALFVVHPANAQGTGQERAASRPELARVHLAVGGRAALFYLPLTVTERL